ncbi:MAG TPA: hypothetical protein VIF84_06855 [Candidatus Limnocylindrales bacterium]
MARLPEVPLADGVLGEVVIGGHPLEVVVLPRLGARLHRVRAFGQDILVGPDHVATYDRDPFMWGGYVMAPWCNRVAAEPIEVGGRTIALAANFRDGSAIHGQVAIRPWQIEAPGSFVVRGGGDAWPWRFEVRERVAVDGAVLRIELSVANLDDAAMPAGIGLHPWFVGPLELAVPAETVLSPNDDTPATPVPVAGETDLRRLAPPPIGLDGTWMDVAGPVELTWPQLGLQATMRVDAPTACIVVASPPGRGAIAVEPETHAPQGIRRLVRDEPGALAMLAPGDRLRLGVELAFERR